MKPIRLSSIIVLECGKDYLMQAKKSKFGHSDGSLILKCALAWVWHSSAPASFHIFSTLFSGGNVPTLQTQDWFNFNWNVPKNTQNKWTMLI